MLSNYFQNPAIRERWILSPGRHCPGNHRVQGTAPRESRRGGDFDLASFIAVCALTLLLGSFFSESDLGSNLFYYTNKELPKYLGTWLQPVRAAECDTGHLLVHNNLY